MDLATVIGLVGGIVLQVLTIALSGNPFALFISASSAVGVILGSFAALLMASPMSRLKDISKYFKLVFNVPTANKQQLIAQLVNLSTSARRHGILSLDDAVGDIDDEFLQLGLRLCVDGIEPDVIEAALYGKLDQLEARHQIGNDFFSNWASYAPGFGMIGTLLGLIGMLANLEDTASLGPNMSLALITTLYGSMFANMILTPIAQKLGDLHNDEMLMKELMLQGIKSIQAGDNPRILEQKLYALVRPEDRPASLE